MCGQGGLAGTITPAGETAFKKLLIMNAVRGTDSTGAASVKRMKNKDGTFEIVGAKEVGHAFNLLETHRASETDIRDVLAGTQRALLGHCRASTRGASLRRNAHPFIFDDVVGTHNGTLDHSSHNTLIAKGRFDTDSECIFNEIQAVGIAETVKKFKDRADAYALVWFDGRDGEGGSINFLKNDKRPLYYAFSKDNEMIGWSSEFYHLAAAFETIPHNSKFMEFENDVHYCWEIPEVNKAFGKCKVVKREPVKTPLVSGGTTNTVWKQHGATSNGSGTGYNYNHNHHSNSNSNSNASDLYDSWLCPHTFFFKKYDRTLRQYVYSQNKTGPFYPTVVECWNRLSDFQKQCRISNKEVPYEISFKKGTNHAIVPEKGEETDSPFKEEKKEVTVDNVVNISDNRKKLADAKKTIRERRLTEYLNNDKSPLVWRDDERVVLWNIQDKEYVVLTFEGYRTDQGWRKEKVKKCPDYVPFTMLDIQARHRFVHQGKKDKKVTFFKGFEGSLLVRKTFETLMTTGCIGCDRIPQWGNDVTFVNKSNFLCEHCARDPMLVKTMIQAAKGQ